MTNELIGIVILVNLIVANFHLFMISKRLRDIRKEVVKSKWKMEKLIKLIER